MRQNKGHFVTYRLHFFGPMLKSNILKAIDSDAIWSYLPLLTITESKKDGMCTFVSMLCLPLALSCHLNTCTTPSSHVEGTPAFLPWPAHHQLSYLCWQRGPRSSMYTYVVHSWPDLPSVVGKGLGVVKRDAGTTHVGGLAAD